MIGNPTISRRGRRRPSPTASRSGRPAATPSTSSRAQESTEPRESLGTGELAEVFDLADSLKDELSKHRHGDLVGQLVGTAVKLLRDKTNRARP